jgi:hypothetical protein
VHHAVPGLADGLHQHRSTGMESARAESHTEEMSPNTRAAARHRPSKLQVALAALWMLVSLAIGGVVGAQSSTDTAGTPPSISRTSGP